MRIAGDNVQADFCAVAADKCKAQVNLLASRGPGGCLSLSLSAETQEGQILSFLGFGRRNLHMQWSCIHSNFMFMHSSNNLPPCRRRAGADAACVPGGRRSARRAMHRQHENVANEGAFAGVAEARDESEGAAAA